MQLSVSPSSLARVVQCPGSAKLIAKLQQRQGAALDHSSDHADEGTEAHQYVADILNNMDGLSEEKEDFRYYADQYKDFLSRQFTELVEQSGVEGVRAFVEWRLPQYFNDSRSCYVDYALVAKDWIFICDFKYGMGVKVEAKHNYQLASYALSAYHAAFNVKDPNFRFRLAIFQPRVEEPESYWDITLGELNEWMHPARKIVANVLSGEDLPLTPSSEACRFCPAKAYCPALYTMTTQPASIPENFSLELPDATNLPLEKLELIALHATEISNFLTACKEETRRRLLNEQGTHTKLVRGRKLRSWEHPDSAKKWMQNFTATPVEETKPISPAKFEKLLVDEGHTKKGAQQILEEAGHVKVSVSSPSIVSIDDKRPALDTLSEEPPKLEASEIEQLIKQTS